MDMKTKDGKPVTEKTLDDWADAFEHGEWPAGRTVALGRPRLAIEEVQSVSFKLTRSKVLALEEKASKLGFSRSEALREAVEEFLANA